MATKRILRNIKGTVDLGILYRRNQRDGPIAYSDSHYARDIDDRNSTSGYVFMMDVLFCVYLESSQ